MLNEWKEFLDYTGPVTYQSAGKKDTTWLGRFTFEALRDFSGLARILTILARGFLFITRMARCCPEIHTPVLKWLAGVCAPGAVFRKRPV